MWQLDDKRNWLGWWCFVLWLVFSLPALAQTAPTQADGSVLRVYVRAGCPHCAAAKAYLPTFIQQHPGLQLEYRPVDSDAQASEELLQLSQANGYWPPGVPAFAYQGQLLVGFSTPAESGPALAALVAGRPTTGLAAHLDVRQYGLPLFTLAVGLLDGFNPCAMWVLLFLLSLLVHLRDRRRMAWIAGTFVCVSGAVYYAFMAAWLNVFLVVGFSSAVRTGLALLAVGMAAFHLKDFAVGLRGPSLSIPAAAKPGLYARMRQVMQQHSLPLALLGVASLAVVVNFIELLCTAGLPAMYTAILTQQGLSPLAHYGYLALYILAYIADDTLMVASAVWALSSQKLDERQGRWLKLFSGVVMLVLGLVMGLRPEWLY